MRKRLAVLLVVMLVIASTASVLVFANQGNQGGKVKDKNEGLERVEFSYLNYVTDEWTTALPEPYTMNIDPNGYVSFNIPLALFEGDYTEDLGEVVKLLPDGEYTLTINDNNATFIVAVPVYTAFEASLNCIIKTKLDALKSNEVIISAEVAEDGTYEFVSNVTTRETVTKTYEDYDKLMLTTAVLNSIKGQSPYARAIFETVDSIHYLQYQGQLK